ncbi:hypothetical protein N836_29885 [Leptolyngbya sp. Heron Island J]|nr:hypothetical protein N836_29885 [Leptolyngbya sp. Heron Island J]
MALKIEAIQVFRVIAAEGISPKERLRQAINQFSGKAFSHQCMRQCLGQLLTHLLKTYVNGYISGRWFGRMEGCTTDSECRR